MIPNEMIGSATLNTLLFYVSVMGVVLLVGIFLRLNIKILKKLFIPASLIAGFIGLAMGPYGMKVFSEEMVSTWGSLAGILITIVFAPMLIGMKKDTDQNEKNMFNITGRHLMYSYTGSLLQIGVPLLITGLFLIPVFKVNELFGTIIEVGWAGGHGTAAGMLDVYSDLGWAAGGSLGVTSATLGIVIGIISGIIIINFGVRKNQTSIIKTDSFSGNNTASDILEGEERQSSSTATLNQDLVEGFAFHMALIGGATLIGWFLQKILINYVQGIPLFPMAMIGGLIINLFIQKTKYFNLIDVNTFHRIQGIALDFLIVGAVASIKVPIVIEYALPLLILFISTILLMLWYFYYLGPKFFKEEWFENAIVHYGSYTGVAAVGLMLLRTVDPEMKTDASKAYALRSPFYSPFLGGGLITALIPVLVLQYNSVIIGILAIITWGILMIFSQIFGFVNFKKAPLNTKS